MSQSAIITHDSRIGPATEVAGYRPQEQGVFYRAAIPRGYNPVSVQVFRGDQGANAEAIEIRLGSGDATDGYEWEWRIRGAITWSAGDGGTPSLKLKNTGDGQIVGSMARARAFGPAVDVSGWTDAQRIFDVALGADAPLPYLQGTLVRSWRSPNADAQTMRWRLPEGDAPLGYTYVGCTITGCNFRGALLSIVNVDASIDVVELDNTWGDDELAYTRSGRILQGDTGLDPGRVRVNRLAGGVVQWPADDPDSAAVIEANSDGTWLSSGAVPTRIKLSAEGEAMPSDGDAFLLYPRRTVIFERPVDKEVDYIQLYIPAQPTPESIFTLTSLCIGPALVLSWRGDRGWTRERSYNNPTTVMQSGRMAVAQLQTLPSQELRMPGGVYVPSTTPWEPGSTPMGYRRSEPDLLRDLLDRVQGGVHPLVYCGGITLFEGRWSTSEPDQMFVGRLRSALQLTQVANDEGSEVWQVGEIRITGEVWQ